MMRFLFLGFVCATLVQGCIEHRPNDTDFIAEKQTEEQFIAEKVYPGLRVYEGKVPCADCRGIEQRLAMKGDSSGIFRLTETYLDATEDGDEVIVTLGEWKQYNYNEQLGNPIFYLSEGNMKDSTRVSRYEIKDKKIQQLDINRKRINNPKAYTLKLVRKE